MIVTRVYTDGDGETHFEDVELPMEDQGEIGRIAEEFQPAGVVFRETGSVQDYDWHNAPRRLYIIMLDGAVEIEVSDGSKRTFRTGDVLRMEDTTGKGHRPSSPDGKGRTTLLMYLD